MKIKLPHEVGIRVEIDDLISLVYHAKQAEIFYHEKVKREERIVALKKEIGRYQEYCTKVKAVRGGAAGQDGTAMDAETMFQALVSIETRLREFNTDGMIEPQKELIKETRRIALDALGKLEQEGK